MHNTIYISKITLCERQASFHFMIKTLFNLNKITFSQFVLYKVLSPSNTVAQIACGCATVLLCYCIGKCTWWNNVNHDIEMLLSIYSINYIFTTRIKRNVCSWITYLFSQSKQCLENIPINVNVQQIIVVKLILNSVITILSPVQF